VFRFPAFGVGIRRSPSAPALFLHWGGIDGHVEHQKLRAHRRRARLVELIDAIGAGPVAIDTSIFIHWIEQHPRYYLPLLRPLFAIVDDGGLSAVISALTLLETLVIPTAPATVTSKRSTRQSSRMDAA
jgi:hypothetical protein